MGSSWLKRQMAIRKYVEFLFLFFSCEPVNLEDLCIIEGKVRCQPFSDLELHEAKHN